MYEGMCFSALQKLNLNLTVKSATEKVWCCLGTSVLGIFSLQNALLSTNFGSTGRLHYFSAIHKVRAHASYMDVTCHYANEQTPTSTINLSRMYVEPTGIRGNIHWSRGRNFLDYRTPERLNL